MWARRWVGLLRWAAEVVMATEAPKQPVSLEEAADSFVEAIHQTDAWRRWEAARQRCDDDAALVATQHRLAELSSRLRAARAVGRGLFGPDLAEFNRLQAELQASPHVRERDQASVALLTFMQDLNRSLSEKLGVDFAVCATPRGGSCCG